MITRLRLEKFLPFVAGILAFLGLMLFQARVVELVSSAHINVSGLYSSVFDWASIQTGFMFGVYGFVVGKSDGFIAEVRNTKAMERFVGYTWTATIIGFVLTLSSMPLIVVGPQLHSSNPWMYPVISAWFGLFLWGFAAFLRVAYIFGIIVRPKSPETIPG